MNQMLQAVLGLVSICSPLMPANAPQASQLNSVWHLDESTGASTLADSAAANVALNSQGRFKSSTPGKIGNAVRSAIAGLGISTTNQILNPQTFSISAWIKASGTGTGVIAAFGNTRTGNPGQYDRFFSMNTSGQLQFNIYASNGPGSMVTPLSYNDGNWHHVALTYGSDVGKLYVDGLNVQTVTLGAAEIYNGYFRIAGGYTVGWTLNTPSNVWLGEMDEFLIHSVVLSDAEVAALASAPAQYNSSSPRWANAIGVYHFDENAGPYLDSGPSANHTTDSEPSATNGFFGRGFSGPGVITLVSSQAISSPDVMTLSLWFRTRSTTGGVFAQFANTQNDNPSDYDRQLFMNANGSIVFGTYGGTFWILTSASGFNDGAWHHLVVTFEQSVQQKLYIDGVERGSITPGTAQSINGYWQFGRGKLAGWESYNNTTSSVYSGELDEIGFWRTVLSGPEVLALYNHQKRCP